MFSNDFMKNKYITLNLKKSKIKKRTCFTKKIENFKKKILIVNI